MTSFNWHLLERLKKVSFIWWEKIVLCRHTKADREDVIITFFFSLSHSLSPLKIRDLCYQIIRAQSNQFLPLFTTRLINLIWGTLLTQKENILIWEKVSARKCVYCWSRITKSCAQGFFQSTSLNIEPTGIFLPRGDDFGSFDYWKEHKVCGVFQLIDKLNKLSQSNRSYVITDLFISTFSIFEVL